MKDGGLVFPIVIDDNPMSKGLAYRDLAAHHGDARIDPAFCGHGGTCERGVSIRRRNVRRKGEA